jgi:ADP-heptose:LPS heptosyltransferase
LVEWKNRSYTVWERMELLKPLGVENLPKLLPKFYLKKREVEEGRREIERLGLKENNFFIVVPTSRRKERSWEPYKFGVLSKRVAEFTGLTPLFAYAPGEEEMAREAFEACERGVLLEEPLSIRRFASVVNLSRFLTGNDSFASHLSLSLKKKTFVILGPNEGWFPEIKGVIKIKKGLECQPCGNWKGCNRELACYKELSVNEVFEKLKTELNVN